MLKRLLMLSIVMGLLAACQPRPKPDEVVMGSVEKFSAGDTEASLAYFADDAVVKLVGLPPGQPDTFTGKEAIRAWWKDMLAQNFAMEVEVVKVDGDEVTTRTLTWMDGTRALGVAPLEATEVYVVKDGKIISEIWTITGESKARLMAAIAAAQATPTPAPVPSVPPPTATPLPPTPAPPTATPAPPSATSLPEVLASKPEDVMGTWGGRYNGEAILIEFKEEGYVRVKWPDSKFLIGGGAYHFEGTQLKWVVTSGDCLGTPAASYLVYVTWQEDKPVRLRFDRIDDACENRVTTLSEAPLIPYAP